MISRLSRREQIFLLAGGTAVVIMAVFWGIIDPYRTSLADLDTRIASRENQVREVQSLRREYLLLKKQVERTEADLSRNTDFSLLSFVEGLAVQIADRENLVYMRPQPPSVQGEYREESVEIKLGEVGLEQVLRFLYEIDGAPAPLKVKNLRVKTRFEDRSRFDVTLTIASYGRAA